MKLPIAILAALLSGLAAPAISGPSGHRSDALPEEASLEAPTCSTCAGVELLDAGKFDAARKIFDRQASRGDVDAMYSLGWMYHHGKGVAVDYAKARALYFQAASGGQNVAMNQMGVFYQNGLGVPKNLVTAYCWYAFALSNAYAPSGRHIVELEAQGLSEPAGGACEVVNHS
jgi:TPR repeat protein